jgi:hypothetical protein
MKYTLPARITVEARAEGEAISRAQYLADATERLRGYDLAVVGAPELAPPPVPIDLCTPCPSRSGASG